MTRVTIKRGLLSKGQVTKNIFFTGNGHCLTYFLIFKNQYFKDIFCEKIGIKATLTKVVRPDLWTAFV